MLISGIQKFTLIDYPGKIATIVFTPGCNMRCRYCHNKEFVLPEEIKKIENSFIAEKTFFTFLTQRINKLDGVVISGGEPSIQKDLYIFIKKIKDLGFLVKLDTNGTNPILLKKLVHEKLIDYVAMDIKTTLANYTQLVGNISTKNIQNSISFLKKNTVDYEFRTTLIHGIHTESIMHDIGALLSYSKKYYLQTFRPSTTLDPLFANKHALSQKECLFFSKILSQYHIEHIEIR